MRKSVWKTNKNNWRSRKKKQINALKDLKLKEQTKVIEDKSNKISSRLLEKELMKYK